jgi:hypothetical protein
VSLSCATSGADIRYTTNGSDPTASSALYTGPFWLQSTASVKARGFKSGMTDSPVASAVFTIGAGGGNVYQASADFSGTQGYRHWTYRSSTGLLTWNGTFWAGAEQYLQLEAGTGHPGATGDAVRRWTAPGAGSIRITGMAADLDAGGGDGVVVSILKNGVSLWQRTIANGGAQQTYDLTADVAAGDVIDFVINKNSTDNYWDNTAFDPTITFTPAVTITNTRPGSYPAGTAAARGMAKYYTVTGVPVAGSGNPAGPGVYLMRTGAAVSKMVVIQ